jgi:hypothetical protein
MDWKVSERNRGVIPTLAEETEEDHENFGDDG